MFALAARMRAYAAADARHAFTEIAA